MNQEDLPSDSDSNDSDYRPVNDSGSDSIEEKDEAIEDQNDEDTAKSKKKRKKFRKTKNNHAEVRIEVETNKTVADPEEEKKRVEALWADFLSGTEIPQKSTEESSSNRSTAKPTQSKTDIPIVPKSKPASSPKIFEFAGETVEMPQKDAAAPDNTLKINNATKPTASIGIKRSGGGLSSVLGQLSKKNKLSVLEKTKLDWDGFKSSEGISEELKTHNRGREGFLERRDFLERTDLRQFELKRTCE